MLKAVGRTIMVNPTYRVAASVRRCGFRGSTVPITCAPRVQISSHRVQYLPEE